MSVSTPPPTTLSTPSPTEKEINVEDEPNMPLSNTRPIYMVVATSLSPPLGIGFRGNLPWPSIKSDMSFFQKVTRDTRPHSVENQENSINAVIMGRKTWESIPQKFRPLSGRLNVVISRKPTLHLAQTIGQELKSQGSDVRSYPLASGGLSAPSDGRRSDSVLVGVSNQCEMPSTPSPVVVSNSVDDALISLRTDAAQETALAKVLKKTVANIFIIGGAEIYGHALRMSDGPTLRILQTQICKSDTSVFECDTFFPVKLGEAGSGFQHVNATIVKGWLSLPGANAGSINLPQGATEWKWDEKAGVDIKVVGWERPVS